MLSWGGWGEEVCKHSSIQRFNIHYSEKQDPALFKLALKHPPTFFFFHIEGRLVTRYSDTHPMARPG